MEPERPIEKLLSAAAKKRREQLGEPLELRPAAREQLHREVASHVNARRADAKGGHGFLGLFSGFTPRLAFGLGVLAIVVLGAWLLWPMVSGKQKPSTLAMNQLVAEKAPAEDRREIATSAPPPAGTPAPAAAAPTVIAGTGGRLQDTAGQSSSVAAGDQLKFKDTERSMDKTDIAAAKQAAPPQPVSAPAGTIQAPSTTSSLASADAVQFDDKRKALDAFGMSTAAPNGVTSVTTFAAAESEAQKKSEAENAPLNFTTNFLTDMPASGVSQRFQRETPATTTRTGGDGGARVAPVLASFQVLRNGNNLSVVDADGSVYTGSLYTGPLPVQPGNATFAAKPATRAAPPTAPAAQIEGAVQGPANYYFRVSGTNRNLNQNVVFFGNLIPLTNALALQTNALAINGAVRQQEQAKTLPMLNARISGTAVIGDQKEIPVNANPVP